MISERQLNPIEAFINDLPDISQNGEARISTGNLLEFNDPDFVAVVKSVQGKNPLIRVVAGPLLIEDQVGQSGLLTLREEGLIEVWFGPCLDSGPYYHVINTDQGVNYYHAEFGKGFSDPIELRRGYRDRPANIGEQVYQLFDSPEACWSGFDAEVNLIKQHGQAIPGIDRIPFLVTRENLQQLEVLAEIQKPDVGLRYMGPASLLGLDRSGTLLRSYL